MGRTRHTFSAQQKSQVALEALRERKTLSKITQQHDVLMCTLPQGRPRQQLDHYIRCTNEQRTHSALGGLTPKMVFES